MHTPPSVNAFALTAEAKLKTLGDIDRCYSLFYVAMASIYNVAQSAMVDAHAFLRQHPAYRQEVKRSARKALLAYERLDKALQQTLGDRYQLWLDLSDNVDDEMRSHIQTLRLSFDAWLLRYNVQQHALLAHMETALTIIAWHSRPSASSSTSSTNRYTSTFAPSSPGPTFAMSCSGGNGQQTPS